MTILYRIESRQTRLGPWDLSSTWAILCGSYNAPPVIEDKVLHSAMRTWGGQTRWAFRSAKQACEYFPAFRNAPSRMCLAVYEVFDGQWMADRTQAVFNINSSTRLMDLPVDDLLPILQVQHG